jgi:hypothetical protein
VEGVRTLGSFALILGNTAQRVADVDALDDQGLVLDVDLALGL